MKKLWGWLKAEVKAIVAALKKAEGWIKSTVAVLIGGGSGALLQMYQEGKHFELSAAHFLELKTRFLGGALLALLMMWMKSPKQGTAPADASKLGSG
jgi:hypothetical protein